VLSYAQGQLDLDEGEWSVSRPGRFTPKETALVLLHFPLRC